MSPREKITNSDPALPEAEVVGPVAWATTPSTTDWLIEDIRSATEVVWDTETTGLEEYAVTGGHANGGVAARVSMATFTLPHEDTIEPTTWVLPLSHPDSPWHGSWRKVMTRVFGVMRNDRKPHVGQNVKFDCRWVWAMTGIDLSPWIVWDTRISAHLLNENASTRLKERAPTTFGVRRWDDHDLSFPGASEQVPLYDLGEYAARDTYWTWRLLEHDRAQMFLGQVAQEEPHGAEEIEVARLGRLATWVSMPTTASLTRMEQRGIQLDQGWVHQEIANETARRQNAMFKIIDRFREDDPPLEGKPSLAATSNWFIAMTERAVERGDLQVGALTPNGNPQWSKAVLTRQARRGSDLALDILAGRQASKYLEYLRSWIKYADTRGVIHPSYNAGSVVTGRLSCQSPNLQQVTKALKPAFVAREGFALVEIDYSQIELRVAAHISGSPAMIAAYSEGRDLHRIMAGQITGKRPEDVTPEERQQGKAADFGLIYGMGPRGFREYADAAYDVLFSEAEANQVHQAFFNTWDGVREWHARQIARVRDTGQVVSPIGRVRRLPDVFDGNPKRAAHAERNAINAPVQGFASDLMQMSAALIQGLLPGSQAVKDAHLVGTVHDSIVIEVPLSRWQEVAAECRERMIHGVLPYLRRMGCDLTVPLDADITAGLRWGTGDLMTERR